MVRARQRPTKMHPQHLCRVGSQARRGRFESLVLTHLFALPSGLSRACSGGEIFVRTSTESSPHKRFNIAALGYCSYSAGFTGIVINVLRRPEFQLRNDCPFTVFHL